MQNPIFQNDYMKHFFSFFQDHFLVQSYNYHRRTFALSSYTQRPIFQDHFMKTGILLQKAVDMASKRKIMTPKPLDQGGGQFIMMNTPNHCTKGNIW